MQNPFPGMNPYLENPVFWSEVHHRLISAIADFIEPHLPKQYRVGIEQRRYLSDDSDSIPDVAVFSQQSVTETSTTEGVTVTLPMPQNIKESYLEVRDIETGFAIATIEILSPKNKKTGEGRKAYELKRKQVLASLSHLVEIDLLRNGKPMAILDSVSPTDYRIVVSRSQQRPQAKLYGFSVRDPIPQFQLPLQLGDTEPIVDLQTLLNTVYQRARYHLAIDYNLESIPTLKAKEVLARCVG